MKALENVKKDEKIEVVILKEDNGYTVVTKNETSSIVLGETTTYYKAQKLATKAVYYIKNTLGNTKVNALYLDCTI